MRFFLPEVKRIGLSPLFPLQFATRIGSPGPTDLMD
jgi:hypothetical protein